MTITKCDCCGKTIERQSDVNRISVGVFNATTIYQSSTTAVSVHTGNPFTIGVGAFQPFKTDSVKHLEVCLDCQRVALGKIGEMVATIRRPRE